MEKNRTAGEKNRAQQKYSLKTYLVVLIIVVLSVVILSYFAQQRNSENGMNAARETNGDMGYSGMIPDSAALLHAETAF